MRLRRLTERQQHFVDGLRKGLKPIESARAAGYRFPVGAAETLMHHPGIAPLVATLRAQAEERFNLSRIQVYQVLIDAVEMAREQQDPQTMIRGAAELARMQGYYAPERHEFTLTGSAQTQLARLKDLPDAELLKLARPVAGRVLEHEGGEEYLAEEMDEAPDAEDLEEDADLDVIAHG